MRRLGLLALLALGLVAPVHAQNAPLRGTTITATTAMETPALKVTTSPVAGYVLTSDGSGNATWQNAVPSGLVAMFTDACPTDWTRLSAWDNKFIRGGATYSATGGGSDTHNHTVDPASVTSSSNGAHTHTVDPVAVDSASAGNHDHTVDPASTLTSSNGDHGHDVIGSTASESVIHTHGYSGTTDGPSATGAYTTIPNEGTAASPAHTHTYGGNTDNGTSTAHSHGVNIDTSFGGAHTHSVDIGITPTSTTGAHVHSVNVGSTTSSSDGAHTHSVDVAITTSSTSSNVPAYVQVIFCQKD